MALEPNKDSDVPTTLYTFVNEDFDKVLVPAYSVDTDQGARLNAVVHRDGI